MPFKKRGKKYVSPSGRTYSKKQVIAYHATGGWRRKVKPKTPLSSRHA
jgi:hypothetical protein